MVCSRKRYGRPSVSRILKVCWESRREGRRRTMPRPLPLQRSAERWSFRLHRLTFLPNCPSEVGRPVRPLCRVRRRTTGGRGRRRPPRPVVEGHPLLSLQGQKSKPVIGQLSCTPHRSRKGETDCRTLHCAQSRRTLPWPPPCPARHRPSPQLPWQQHPRRPTCSSLPHSRTPALPFEGLAGRRGVR